MCWQTAIDTIRKARCGDIRLIYVFVLQTMHVCKRYTPMRCTREIHAYEIHACEMHAYETYVRYEVYRYKVQIYNYP